MNSHTTEIMKLCSVDTATALRIQHLMDCSGIDYSQCTTREFNATAREAARDIAAEDEARFRADLKEECEKPVPHGC